MNTYLRVETQELKFTVKNSFSLSNGKNMEFDKKHGVRYFELKEV